MENPWKHQFCAQTHPILGECYMCMLKKSWDGGFNEGGDVASAAEDTAFDNGVEEGHARGYEEGYREGYEAQDPDREWEDLLDELISRPGGVLTSP